MEQPKEEVPEVREEEEEEEEVLTAISGASDANEGPDNSAPSVSYTGKLERQTHQTLLKENEWFALLRAE